MKRWDIQEEKEFANWQKNGFIGQVWRKILMILLKTSVSALVRETPCSATGSLGTIKSSGQLDIVGIDFLKVDQCSGGYEYILVISDHFTRCTQVYATKKKSAQTAASELHSTFW